MLRSFAAALFAAVFLCFAPLQGIAPAASAGNLLFTNNASTTLASAMSSTVGSVTVAATTGARFPIISSTGQHFRATIVKSGTPSQFEIVLVTATSGDTFTITRAQEGTTAQGWSVGDFFNIFITAADFGEFSQIGDLQAQSGNYAADTGTANAYVVALSPALTQHNLGMPIRVKFANANTGASTFNDGAGALQLVTPDLQPLVAGNVQGGGIGTLIYDGARVQLFGAYRVSFSQINGQIGTAQVPLSAVAQYEPQLFAGPVFTGVPTAPTATPGTSNGQLATTAFVQAALGAVASFGTTGYYQMPAAAGFGLSLIVEWGYVQDTSITSGPTDLNVTFPRTFPNACVGVFVASNRNVATGGQANLGSGYSSNYSQSGATITVDNSGSNLGGVASGHWIAIGY